MELKFEPLTEKYSKDVMDIFNYYVENSYAAYPEQNLPYQFFNKFLEMAKGYPAYVIKDNTADRVIGFCLLRVYNPMPSFKETAEITYFIDKDEVGKGVGKVALKLLEDEGRKMGIKHILASISSYNEQSLNFHKRNGFNECGRFHNVGRKKGNYFDEVWMEKHIG
jgi:phosphinothricin acetyltransferase